MLLAAFAAFAQVPESPDTDIFVSIYMEIRMWRYTHTSCTHAYLSRAQVQESSALTAIVGVTLAVGNHLNHGHLRGNALAFDLSVLAQLRELRDNAKDKSLLHYILVLCKRHAPLAFHLPRQLSLLPQAAAVDLEALKYDLKALHVGVTEAQAYLASCPAAPAAAAPHAGEPGGAGVAGGLRLFLEEAAVELKRADAVLLEVMAGFKALLVFLGRRPVEAEADVLTCPDLVQLLAAFVADVDAEIRRHFSRTAELAAQKQRRQRDADAPARTRRAAPSTVFSMRRGGAVTGATVIDACGRRGVEAGVRHSARQARSQGQSVMQEQAKLGASWLVRSLDSPFTSPSCEPEH